MLSNPPPHPTPPHPPNPTPHPTPPQLLAFHEDKYMTALWQTECAAYMRRYERANKSAASFTADIQKYLDLREQVGLGRVCVCVCVRGWGTAGG